MCKKKDQSNTKGYLRKYIFSDQLAMESRLLNVAASFGFLAALAVFVLRLIDGVPPVACIAMILLLAMIALMFIANNRPLFNRVVAPIILSLICQIIFPIIFFTCGGIRSDHTAYFVLSITLIFLLFRGKIRIVSLFIHIAIIVTIYCMENVHPYMPFELTSGQRLADHLRAIIVGGIFIGLVVLFQNKLYMQEKRKVEEALVNLERESRTVSNIFNGNPDGSALIDRNFKLIDCNQAMVELMGLANKEDLLKNFSSIMEQAVPAIQKNGQTALSMKARMNQAIASGYVRFETELNLSVRNATVSITMQTIPYRENVAILLYMADLTDLYATRNRMLYRDRLISAVNRMSEVLLSFNNSQDSFDTSMKIIAQCIDVDRIHVWKKEPAGGAPQYICESAWESDTITPPVHTVHCMEVISLWENSFFNGQVINSPINKLTSAEKEKLKGFDVKSILIVPVFQQGKLWGFISFSDCRKERIFTSEEETVLRSASLLIVNAILRNEMTENLVKSKEEALSSAKAKSIFLANMSHEMRTPINAVVGMTTIGKAAGDPKRKDYCFENIENASKHLMGIINDVLDMSKIEADKLELSPVEFNFEKMLQQVTGVINFRAEQKQQRFTVYIDQNIPKTLRGDELRLAQVITNLLGNAIKFTPEMGVVTLEARLVAEEKCRCTIEIRISDTGIGISKDQFPLLFQYFQQVDDSASRKFGGTGLGLAISKRLVELMGGEIRVESEPGKGSVFSFTIKADRISIQTPTAENHINWKNARMMVVDDDPKVLRYFQNTMPQFGIACDVALSGEEALRIRKRNAIYDIYFVAWKMSGLSGMEFLQSLLRIDAGKTGGIVIMTSAAPWESIAAEVKKTGVDKYISKPLFLSSIKECLNKCLNVKKTSAVKPAAVKPDGDENIFKGRRILLAEDIAINREIVAALLEPTGVEIIMTENGEETVKKFRENPDKYNLIFMDMQMPIMDGCEATRRIRAFEAKQNGGKQKHSVPIVAMTANVFQEDVRKCLDAGMNGHLGKPLDIKEVLGVMRTYLS